MNARKSAYPAAIRELHERERLQNLGETSRRYRENATAEFRKAVAIKAGFARGDDPELAALTPDQIVAMLDAAHWFSRQAAEAIKVLLMARPLS
jgi:hypothetical protein